MQAVGSIGRRGFVTTAGALAVVAAWSVGFAVGDALAAPFLNAATIAGASRAGEDFHGSWRIPAGKAIEVKGINGDVRAERTAGSSVVVDAIKSARRSDPASVEIEVIEHDGGITLCAHYPEPRGSRPNECRPGRGGHMSNDNNDVTVDWVVRVPEGVRFVGRTVNGGVEAESLDGPVEAYTVNGSVSLSTDGYAIAETVNGSIHADIGASRWPEPLEFKTVNGTITLVLPEDAGAELHAKTMNGEIVSDFPVMARGRIGKHRLSGTIGRGGSDLDLQTLNGTIHLTAR